MTLVHAETGEVVSHCTPDEARELTERIRLAGESLWSMLAEAHGKGAWKALGYGSFVTYCDAEFGMKKSHAYRLLDQAQVIEAISAAAGLDSPMGEISERDARDLKPHLEEVTDRVSSAVQSSPEADPAEVTRNTVTQIREEKRTQVESSAGESNAPAAPADDSYSFEDVHPDLAYRGRFDKAMSAMERIAPFDPHDVADAYCTDADGLAQIKSFMHGLRRFAQGLEDGINRNNRLRSVK